MSWAIEVDSETCIGSGMCVGVAPEHFTLEGWYSSPTKSQVEPADEVIDAVESCPVEAITVRDTDTGALVAPTD